MIYKGPIEVYEPSEIRKSISYGEHQLNGPNWITYYNKYYNLPRGLYSLKSLAIYKSNTKLIKTIKLLYGV